MAGSTPFPQDNVEQVFWHVLWWVQAGETPPLRSDSCFEEDKGQRRWGGGSIFCLGKEISQEGLAQGGAMEGQSPGGKWLQNGQGLCLWRA